MWIYLIIGIVFLLLIYIFIVYNSLVSLNNKVKEAFATMDVYLKQRWDLIPNLVEIVKGYAKHEKDTLESVINLRNITYDKMSTSEKINTNEELTARVSKLMLLAESYPDLKANQNFLDLSSHLTKVEDHIANLRKYFNAIVRNLKVFSSKLLLHKKNLFENKLFFQYW